MFTILIKDVDGRRSYRYFRECWNAEAAMMRDIKDVKKLCKIVDEIHVDRFNVEKGIREREETLVSVGNMRFHYALIDGYFEDNND